MNHEKVTVLLVVLLSGVSGFAFHHPDEQEEKASIEKVIKDAYIDSVHSAHLGHRNV